MATHAVILYPSRILHCILRLIADWLMGKEEVQHGSHYMTQVSYNTQDISDFG
jgi:hypothetical protein